MEFDSLTHSTGMLLQVVLMDLLLSGDNALVIALVCGGLPLPLRKRAILLGTGLAIGLRVVLTLLVSILLMAPLLKLVGAVLLLAIAIKLLLGDGAGPAERAQEPEQQLGSAVLMVVVADAALSLDNVMGLAGATQGEMLPLLFGLALSMPLLMFGSLFISRLLDDNPWLVPAGALLMAWVAGQLAVGDPLLADWVDTQAPALQLGVPLACMLFVLVETRIIRRQRQRLGAPPKTRLGSYLAELVGQFAGSSGEGREPAPRVAAVDPVPALAPVVVLQPIEAKPRLEPARVLAPGGTESTFGGKLMMWTSLAICLLTVLWLAAHLLDQGLLPPPQHPV